MESRFEIVRGIQGLKLISALVLFFLGGMLFLFWYVQDLQDKMLKTAALESARLYSDALKEFRTIYTSEVIEKIRAHPDIEVSHDYYLKENSIPLPATLSMKLGERIGLHLKGAETSLYSPYPFPWREKEGGLKDKFKEKAWQFLNLSPDLPYYQFVNFKGRPVLRYATADVMRRSCIACHNSHPQSPKVSWRLGEVRGVLEIIHPMENTIDQTAAGNRGIFLLALAFISTVLFFLILVVYKFQKNTRDLESQVKQRSDQIKVTEKELNSAKKMAAIGEISSGIAHEINQPLSAIRITNASLKKSVNGRNLDRANGQVDRIETQIDRIDNIIKQLNTHNTDITGQDYQVIPINRVINGAYDQVSELLEKNACQIEMNVPKEELVVLGDELELQRVLINVFTNAMHALEKNLVKKIVLTVNNQSNDIQINIEDNGPGIPVEIQDKIFDPFYTTKEVGKGTGLGLSLCYGILKKHKGNIKLDESFTLGTRISISLPIFKGAC
jgi:signal transduction histidine kinase